MVSFFESVINKLGFKINENKFEAGDGRYHTPTELAKRLGSRKNKSKLAKALPPSDDFQEYLMMDYRDILPFLKDIQSKNKPTAEESLAKLLSKYQVNYKLGGDIDNHSYILLDRDTFRPLYDIDPITFLNKLNQGESGVFKQDAIYVKRVFDTTRFETHWEGVLEEGSDCIYVNTYVVPDWCSVEASKDQYTEDNVFYKFIKHLFPDDKDREFVLDWMHHCVFDRATTFLYTPGSQGVGKGRFAEMIKHLCGKENTANALASFPNQSFNHYVYRKKFVYCDEYKNTDPDRLQFLKLYTEEDMAFNGKNLKEFTDVLDASFYMSNNGMGFVRVNPDDRRFNIPKVTDVKLKEGLDKETLRVIFKTRSEVYKKDLAIFGRWLEAREPKYAPEDEYRNEFFYEVSLRSQSVKTQKLVSYLLKCEDDEVSYEDIQRELRDPTDRTKWLGVDRVVEFFEAYRPNGEMLVKELLIENGELTFILNESTRKEETILGLEA